NLAAAGGTVPFAWSVSVGALPAGLSLSAAGVISGKMGAAGTSNFTVQVTDSGSQTATKALSITITLSLTITTASLTPGVAGVAYSQNLEAAGGTAPFAWSVSVGALPAGLSLSAAGVISG